MDIDEFYVKTNNQFNRVQKTWFFALSLLNFYAPFHMIFVVFTGPAPKFNCTIGNETFTDSCGKIGEDRQCDSIDYDPEFPDSFVTTWSSSPCNTHISQVVQMAFMLGVMIGALTLGPMADSVGRKPVLIGSLLGMISFSSCASFVPSAVVFVIIRFFVGICSAGSMISSFVLSSEIVGPSVRGICGNVFQTTFSFGIMGYSLMAYIIQDNWRMLNLAASLVGAPMLVIAILAPESPRWLFANAKTHKGKRNLQLLTGIAAVETSIVSPPRRMGNITLLTMLKYKFCLVTTQVFSWFTNSVVYYALTLSAHQLGDNIFVTTGLSGLVEVPAYFLTAIVLDRIGRRLPLVLTMVVAGVSCITLVFTDGNLYIGLLGKMCIAASFSIIYIHSSELFPTVVRNSGVGLCSSFARIGGVVASVFVGRGNNQWQIVSLGILAIVAGLLNATLPETVNRKLPDTLDDLNRNDGDYTRLLNDERLEEEDDIEEFSRKGRASYM